MKVFKLLLMVALLKNYACVAPKKLNKQDAREKGYVMGTVQDDRKISGCSFSILLENQKIITPQNLDSKFQKNNLKVWVKYKPLAKQPLTICMRGEVVIIEDILKQ